jgi:hypothetical protein
MKISFDSEKCIDSDSSIGEFVLKGIRKDTATVLNRNFNGKKVRVTLESVE